MPYSRSTPEQTLARISAEIAIALPGADANLRYSVEQVIARMLAMASYEMDGYIAYVMRQILPTTCDEEFLPLFGVLWKIPRNSANAASGTITFTGTNGSVIPAAKTLQRGDGQLYTLAADVTISAGTGTGSVTANIAGDAGNTSATVMLSLVSPIAGVESAAVVATGGISGGVDIEDAEAWRSRIVARYQNPPMGGADFDYDTWCKEVPGVTRVWVYPNQLGRGSVYIQFVMDKKEDTIIPTVDEVEAVQDYINSPYVRPTTADVTIAAPTPVGVDFEINLSPNTLAVRTAVRAELNDLIRRESIPGGTLLISHIREAISVAAGEADHVLVSPSANVTRSFGQISIIGDVTFGAIP